MRENASNPAPIAPDSPRQHSSQALPGTALEWRRLLALRAVDQPVAAGVLLAVALAMAGWYLWRVTTPPGMVELEQSEPLTSKLVVNINTAEAAELMLLPEIGKTTAVKIVEDRLANGDFRNPQEFGLRIRGIGPKTLPKLTPYLEGWTDD